MVYFSDHGGSLRHLIHLDVMDLLPEVVLMHHPLVSISVGEFVEIRAATFNAAFVRPGPDVDVHLMTLELAFFSKTLTAVADIRLLMLLHMLIDLMILKLGPPFAFDTTNFAFHDFAVSLGIMSLKMTQTRKSLFANLTLGLLVIISHVFLQLLVVPYYSAAQYTGLGRVLVLELFQI